MKQKTSWENVKNWYDQAVGATGQYYHSQIILPKLLNAWNLEQVENPAVLDLACGQGVLSRALPPKMPYLGVDASPSLIQAAKKMNKDAAHKFLVADISRPLSHIKERFSHIAIILALQNIEYPLKAFQNCARLLRPQGMLSIVINHPIFRIPRQTGWGEDLQKKLQFRRIDGYMTAMRIPIQIHPGKPSSETETISFHWPLHQISARLKEAGFVISEIDEWCSNKESTGSKARMENRARREFPLFMLINSCLA